MLIAGVALFVVGLVATAGVPDLDTGLTGSPDDDAGGEPPGLDEPEENGSAGEEPTGDGGDTDPPEETPPNDSDGDDGVADRQDGGGPNESEDNETNETGENAEALEEELYTYSVTVEVDDADSGEPVEGVPVYLYPVDSDPEQYTTDEDGEVTLKFEHTEPDDTFEYVLAVGEGERIVDIEQGEQTEQVPLSSDPADLDGTGDG